MIPPRLSPRPPELSCELLERYSTSAPRYTSYPTALDWEDAFEPASYPERLWRAADRPEPLSVYVHLPYCAERCLFCGCNVVITRSEARMESYLDALAAEFGRVAAGGIGRRPVGQLHWGGGTPTHLSPRQIERVQRAFGRGFQLAPDAEVSIEVDPRSCSPAQVARLAELGFNRISVGVQDFDPRVQAAVKRVQTESETRAVLDAARASGFRSVNVDLIYGLPHQTSETFGRTVERVLELRPDRVALFHYAHVPWMKKHQRALPGEALPATREKLRIFVDALEAFLRAGYAYLGLDHFALPDDALAQAFDRGELHRNFMGYTTRGGGDLLGFGASSIGEVAGAYVQNAPAERDYGASLASGGLACARGHVLSADDRLRRDVILSILCNARVDKAAIEAAHGVNFDATFAREAEELAGMEADGLLVQDPEAIRLTALGRLFLRNAAVPFDRYYRARRARGDDPGRRFSRTH